MNNTEADILAKKADKLADDCERTALEEEKMRKMHAYSLAMGEFSRLEKKRLYIDWDTVKEWEELEEKFKNINFNDSSDMAMKCNAKAAATKKKLLRNHSIGNAGGTLQIGIVIAYLFMLFKADFLRQYFNQIQAGKDGWLWGDYLNICLPMGVCALSIGMISALFMRGSLKDSGKKGVITVCFIQSIILGFWFLDYWR
jgi:hypothetical protein